MLCFRSDLSQELDKLLCKGTQQWIKLLLMISFWLAKRGINIRNLTYTCLKEQTQRQRRMEELGGRSANPRRADVSKAALKTRWYQEITSESRETAEVNHFPEITLCLIEQIIELGGGKFVFFFFKLLGEIWIFFFLLFSEV